MTAATTPDLATQRLQQIEHLKAERDRYREALEIAAPYVDQKSERGQDAYIVVQSALGVETMQRLGLRVFS